MQHFISGILIKLEMAKFETKTEILEEHIQFKQFLWKFPSAPMCFYHQSPLPFPFGILQGLAPCFILLFPLTTPLPTTLPHVTGGDPTSVSSPLPFPSSRDPNNHSSWSRDSLVWLLIKSIAFIVCNVASATKEKTTAIWVLASKSICIQSKGVILGFLMHTALYYSIPFSF